MLRRLIVVVSVLAVAAFLMFLNNRVLVGEQELQALVQELPTAETTPGERTFKITFADLSNNLVHASDNEKQLLIRRLEGNQSIAKIPYKKLSDVTPDYALEITVDSKEVVPDDLRRRVQGSPFKRPNEPRAIWYAPLGIDLRGGVEFICQLRDQEGKIVAADDEVMHVLRSRLDERGLTEPVVTKLSNGEIQVVIPGGSRADAVRTRKVLEDTGQLEFREIIEEYEYVDLKAKDAKVVAKPNGGYTFGPDVYHNRGDIVAPKRVEPGFTPTHFYRLGKAELSGSDVASAHQTLQNGEQAVAINFSAAGATKNEQFTTRLYQTGEFGTKSGTGRLGILFDGVVQSDPRVVQPSKAHCVITGHFTQDEIDRLRTSLRAGSLTVTPEVISERVVGATLGVESVQRAMWALIGSFLAIVAFMAIYYRRLGFVANLCLAVTCSLIFATLAIFSATVTLPGLAGLVLSIGMAVDTNILVFERIREELRENKGLPYAIERGYDRAFLTILDANLTTFITALILYYIGSGPVQGFGLTLMIGLGINMFSGVYVGRMLTEWLTKGKETVNMAGWVPPIRLPYVRWRFMGYTLSIIMGVLGFLYFVFGHHIAGGSFQRNFDIDFTGGNMVQVIFKEEQSLDSIEKAIKNTTAANGDKLTLLDDVRAQAYVANIGDDTRTSRQWVFRGRDEEGSVLEAKRAEMEEVRAEKVREANRARNATPPNDAKARQIDKEIAVLAADIAAVQDQIQKRTIEFQKQIAQAFPGAIAEEGDEVRKASFTDRTASLTLTTLDTPQTDDMDRIAAALTKRDEIENATVTAASDGAAGMEIKVTYLATPSQSNAIRIEDPALSRISSLLGNPEDAFTSSRAKILFDLYSTTVQLAAKERITVTQPFPSSEHFSGQVADQMKIRALVAMILSLLAILAYVAARFEFRFGIGSVVALVHDVVLTIGILSLLHYRIDLTVVAALLTIVGFSINDTIVTYDRVRENLPKMIGSTLSEIIDVSIAQTMSRTVLTTGTVLATVIVLFFFGGDALQPFSMTLIIGFTLGTYSSIFVASPLLLTFQKKQEPPATPPEVIVTPEVQPAPAS